MADDDSEPDLSLAREPPTRALTRLSASSRQRLALTLHGACTHIVGSYHSLCRRDLI
jgi:hypothetical protein